jgi:hypothetical protein
MNKTSVPYLVESFGKIAKDEAAKFFFFLESLRSNCIVLIVDGQWNVLAKTRLVFIYEIVINRMIANMFINYSFY